MIKDSYAGEVIRSFGLTDRDIYLYIAAMNGCGLVADRAPDTSEIREIYLGAITPEALFYEMGTAAQQAHLDREAFGRCLDGIEGDSPDAPMEYMHCAERLAALTQEEAIALRFFVLGFWAGAREAEG